MIIACTVNKRIVVTIDDKTNNLFRLERHCSKDDTYLVYCGEEHGFCAVDEENGILPVGVKADFLDNFNLEDDVLYSYRYCAFDAENPTFDDYQYSNWIKYGTENAIGYTFGNYTVPTGKWGDVVTADDLRYTYLWGTDFKATNGQSYTDEQIQYFIDAALTEIERELDITIKKRKIRCNASERGLEKGKDYDVDESVYDFRYSRIARYGFIKTRQKPIIRLHKLELLSRFIGARDLTKTTIIDKQKGILKFMERPPKPSETSRGVSTAISMYGSETLGANLFYAIDYDAGFETSDDVPADLREIIAKQAAISLLNIIGDGLMSGFSSSSLSMDGLSESFSSTQSATSAYFGARIAQYKDDIKDYISNNKYKFQNRAMGAL